MPFTLSHPAAVLPFLRTPLVPAALVAGAMAPDVPYFVPVPRYAGAWYEPFLNGTHTHAWPGLLTVAVPTALVLVALWWCVRSPLADLVVRTPAAPGPRAAAPARPRWAWAAWFVGSLVVGVLTHVLWDSFTHWDGVAVQHLPPLRAEVAGIGVARILQHLSTVVGGLVLVVWGARRWRDWRDRGGRLGVTRGRAVVIGAVVLLAVLGALASAWVPLTRQAHLESIVFELVTGAGAATGVAVLLHALVWHVAARRRAG